MESKKIENPQAFPVAETQWSQGEQYLQAHPGMTLRDYFAAKAMNGLYSTVVHNNFKSSEQDIFEDAEIFYKIADAMLKARQSKATE